MQTAKRGEEMRKIKLCLNDRWRSNYTKQPIQAFEKNFLNKMMATLNKIEISQLWTFFFFFFWFEFSAVHIHGCVLTAVTLVSLVFSLFEFWNLKVHDGWVLFFCVCFFPPRIGSRFDVYRECFGGWIQLTAEHNAKPGPADPLLLRQPAKQVFRFQINSLVYHQQATRQQNERKYRSNDMGKLDE